MGDSSLLTDFVDLFTGNSAGHGKHKLFRNKWKNWNKTGPAKISDYESHLRGVEGLGIVPIRFGDTCVFSCIDFDEHHRTKEETDIVALSEHVHDLALPFMVCRSKGGGAHLYAFYDEPVEATKARQLMKQYIQALKLSSEDSEIFPKQARIQEGQMGNTINLPYFDSKNTARYAIMNGRILTLKEFMHQAHERMIKADELDEILGGEHKDAPPCLQHIIQHGIDSGNRNEALYNLSIYMRKRHPHDYRDRLYDMNSVVFKVPLQIKELRRTISSATRREYKYRCNEAPCRLYCDKDTCAERIYGISPDDIDGSSGAKLVFTKVKKHLTQPVQWELFIGEFHVCLSTHDLMDYRRVTEAVADAATIMIPAMKNHEWQRLLQQLMDDADVVEAPADATTSGMFLFRLTEFLRKARIPPAEDKSDDKVFQNREGLLRGFPIIENATDEEGKPLLIAHFRANDFMEALKRARVGNVTGSALWNTLRTKGVRHGRVRINKNVLTVWSVRIELNAEQQAVPVFSADF